MADLTETISQALFKKSSRLNAPENQNEDFQKGSEAGLVADPYGIQGPEWEAAYASYGSPEPSDPRWELWSNWKRGFHAARMQKALFKCALNDC